MQNNSKDNAKNKINSLENLSLTKPSILVAAGGTGGHVNPALAIARALVEKNPQLQIVFCGNAGNIEEDLVGRSEFAFYPLSSAGLFDQSFSTKWNFLKANWKGLREALKLFKHLNVKACIGVGGYVCVPVLLAARLKRVKYFLHDANAFPGRTIRFFASGAEVVFLSYEESKDYLPKTTKMQVSGNPVNEKFFQVNKEESRKLLDIDPECFYILITGGSQGAKSLNNLALDLAGELKAEKFAKHNVCVHLVTGKSKYAEVVEDPRSKSKLMKLDAYTYSMPEEMSATDLVISRSGAGNCAEIQALGKPSVLVPYPYATNKHQDANAEVLVENGAAYKLDDQSLDARELANIIWELMNSPEKLAKMSRQAKELSHPKAAEEIADRILKSIDI